MAYSSPFHIIHYFGVHDLSEDPEFRRLQKKFIAEFNLPGNVCLTINQVEYSRDDIIKAIDGFRDLSFMPLHQLIFEHPETLRFFEDPKGPVQVEEVMSFLDTMITHADHGRLRELLLEALQERTKHHLSVHHYKAQRETGVLVNYLQEYQEIRLNETIRKQLFRLIYVLSAYHEKRITDTDPERRLSDDIGFLWTDEFIDFMNRLPEEFREVEQTLNEALLYVVIYCYNHYNLSPAFHYRFIDALLQLESLNRYTRNQLYNYRDEVEHMEKQEAELGKGLYRFFLHGSMPVFYISSILDQNLF